MTNCPVYATIDEVLAGKPATAVTRRLVGLAISGGLRPHLSEPSARPGLYPITLDYPSADGLFGCLYVSATTGVAARAFLCWGNAAPEREYRSVAAIRGQLRKWHATNGGRKP